MDWRSELKETLGVYDEEDSVDLNDLEGREMLSENHLCLLRRKQKVSDADVIEAELNWQDWR